MADRRTRQGRKLLARRSDGALFRDLSEDRLGIEALPPGQDRRNLRWLAWTLIVLTYFVGWGLSTQSAITTLMNQGEYERRTITLDDYLFSTASDAVVLLLAITGIMLFGMDRNRLRVPWRTSWRTFFVYSLIPVGASACASAAAAALGLDHYDYPEPYYPHDWLHLVDTVSSAMAGPTEELALLALPVIALRRVGHSWTTVCVTAACLRVPFHMYYGWTTIIFAAWAIAAVFLYRRTGAIAAIILAHAAHNAFISLNPLIPGIYLTNLGICILAVVVIACYCQRQRQRVITAYSRPKPLS